MFKHILVPLDTSTESAKALSIATAIARAAHARVTLLHAISLVPTYAAAPMSIPYSGAIYQRAADDEVIRATSYLKATAQQMHDCGVEQVDVEVMMGSAVQAINASIRDCDLIVMTTHGRTGIARTMLGSVADEVVRGANLPVLLVSARHQIAETNGCAPNFTRILVPLDGSQLAEQALPIAGAMAEIEGAEVLLLNVVPMEAHPANRPITDNRDVKADMYLNQAGVCVLPADVQFETLESGGEPGAAIVNIAREHGCDLIVMSTHGRGGFSRMRLGSVADEVLSQLPVPVLLMHGQDERN